MEEARRNFAIRRIMRKLLMMFVDSPLISGRLRARLYKFLGVGLTETKCVFVGRRVVFDGLYLSDISIGKNTIITSGVKILSHYLDTTKPIHSFVRGKVRIGENVFIGMNALIVKPVTIGDGAVIAAGAVVIDDIEELAIVAGVPARTIGYRNGEMKEKC